MNFQPRIEGELADEIDYDSSDSAVSDLDSAEEEDDVFDTNTKPKSKPKDNTEHTDPNSFSWCVMRLAIVKILLQQLHDFLNVAGIEMQGIYFHFNFSILNFKRPKKLTYYENIRSSGIRFGLNLENWFL